MKNFIITSVLFLISVPAIAQDAGMFGLTFRIGGSSSIGAIYNPIANLAIRPSISLVTSTSESIDDDGEERFGSFESEGINVGYGLAMQYYLHTWNDLAAYIGIGGSYSTSKDVSTTTQRSSFQDTTYSRTTKTERTGINGFLGVQYNLVKWFALHAEIGGGYSFNKTEYVEDPSRRSKGNSFSLSNSGVGIIVYF